MFKYFSCLYFAGTVGPTGRNWTTWAHGSARPSRTERAVDSRRSCKSVNTPDINTHTEQSGGDYLVIYYKENLQAGEYLWQGLTFFHVWGKEAIPRSPRTSVSLNVNKSQLGFPSQRLDVPRLNWDHFPERSHEIEVCGKYWTVSAA